MLDLTFKTMIIYITVLQRIIDFETFWLNYKIKRLVTAEMISLAHQRIMQQFKEGQKE